MDLCRQAIAFASPADLAACLRAVAADGDARVLRVKNRLARDHRAGSSAGYRDVAVNLQAPPPARQCPPRGRGLSASSARFLRARRRPQTHSTGVLAPLRLQALPHPPRAARISARACHDGGTTPPPGPSLPPLDACFRSAPACTPGWGVTRAKEVTEAGIVGENSQTAALLERVGGLGYGPPQRNTNASVAANGMLPSKPACGDLGWNGRKGAVCACL